MDIVERLRKQHIVTTKKLFPYIPFHEYVSWGDAADEIERLRKRYAKLLKKLEYCTGYSDDCIDEEEYEGEKE